MGTTLDVRTKNQILHYEPGIAFKGRVPPEMAHENSESSGQIINIRIKARKRDQVDEHQQAKTRPNLPDLAYTTGNHFLEVHRCSGLIGACCSRPFNRLERRGFPASVQCFLFRPV